jgi:hypothetical protein
LGRDDQYSARAFKNTNCRFRLTKEIEMGTGRKFSKKPMTRPKKGAAGRRKRVNVHKARLIKLGFEPAALEKMTVTDVRVLLNKYAKNSTRKEVEALMEK